MKIVRLDIETRNVDPNPTPKRDALQALPELRMRRDLGRPHRKKRCRPTVLEVRFKPRTFV